MKIVEMLLNYLDFFKIILIFLVILLICVSFLLISFNSSFIQNEFILNIEKRIYIPFFINKKDLQKSKNKNESSNNVQNKDKIELKEFYQNEIKLNSNKFILSKKTENISHISEKLFDINNNINEKNDELSKMFIESLSSLNSWKNNELENELFKEINWNCEKIENDEESIVSQYVFPKFNKKNISSSEIEKKEKELLTTYKLGICRTFEKSEDNKIKSNIAKEVNGNIFKVYSKGNPNLIKEKCKIETIPENFNEIYEKYKEKGYEIIGLSGKKLKMNYLQSQKIERAKCESNMTFLGFIIYRINDNKENCLLLIKDA